MAGSGSVESYFRSLLRLVAGFTFSEHGWQKLFGILGGVNGHSAHVHYFSLHGLAGTIETVAGALIFLGLLTRYATFVAAGEMAVAYSLVHNPRGFWPIVNQGELAVLYCFVFLFLFTAGAGPISFDHILHRSS